MVIEYTDYDEWGRFEMHISGPEAYDILLKMAEFAKSLENNDNQINSQLSSYGKTKRKEKKKEDKHEQH